jgi:hypothetical protein
MTNHYAPILGAYDVQLLDFSFSPDRIIPSVDFSTGETLTQLLRSQFKDSLTVMTYVCDEHDGRQAARQRKFQTWTEKFMPDFNHQPIKMEIETEAGMINRFVGLLTHPDFPYEGALTHHLIAQLGTIVDEKNTPG